LLPACAHVKIPVTGERIAPLDERVLKLQLVFVDPARAARTTTLECAVQFDESAQMASPLQIRVQRIALQPYAMRVLRFSAEPRVVRVLVPLTNFAAELDVPVEVVQREMRQGVQSFAFFGMQVGGLVAD